MRTVAELLAGSGLPRLEARMLLEQAARIGRTRQSTWPELEVPEADAARFDALVARRLAGEPIAYLVGVREFFGRDFHVAPGVLIPRPETEVLVEFALAHLPPQARCLDMGTGSGAIAVSIALERPDTDMTALDVSPAALAIASGNARDLGARCRFLLSDWFAALEAGETFDLIASNPPYVASGDPHLEQGDLRFEPPGALTDFADGLQAIRLIAAGAASRLRPEGWLAIEHGYDQGEACRTLFAAAGLEQVATLHDLAGLDRVTVGQRA